MSDLVNNLRRRARRDSKACGTGGDCLESHVDWRAADRIEKLEEAIHASEGQNQTAAVYIKELLAKIKTIHRR